MNRSEVTDGSKLPESADFQRKGAISTPEAKAIFATIFKGIDLG
jgi:hypothetical protein